MDQLDNWHQKDSFRSDERIIAAIIEGKGLTYSCLCRLVLVEAQKHEANQVEPRACKIQMFSKIITNFTLIVLTSHRRKPF